MHRSAHNNPHRLTRSRHPLVKSGDHSAWVDKWEPHISASRRNLPAGSRSARILRQSKKFDSASRFLYTDKDNLLNIVAAIVNRAVLIG